MADASLLARPIIAVDCDEVLADHMEALISWHASTYPLYMPKLTMDSFSSYRFSEVWGGTDQDSLNKVESFLQSRHFEEMRPLPGAAEVLRSLLGRFRFVVVTARQLNIAAATRRWLDRHFAGIFDDVLFGNAWGTSGMRRSVARGRRDSRSTNVIAFPHAAIFFTHHNSLRHSCCLVGASPTCAAKLVRWQSSTTIYPT